MSCVKPYKVTNKKRFDLSISQTTRERSHLVYSHLALHPTGPSNHPGAVLAGNVDLHTQRGGQAVGSGALAARY